MAKPNQNKTKKMIKSSAGKDVAVRECPPQWLAGVGFSDISLEGDLALLQIKPSNKNEKDLSIPVYCGEVYVFTKEMHIRMFSVVLLE